MDNPYLQALDDEKKKKNQTPSQVAADKVKAAQSTQQAEQNPYLQAIEAEKKRPSSVFTQEKKAIQSQQTPAPTPQPTSQPQAGLFDEIGKAVSGVLSKFLNGSQGVQNPNPQPQQNPPLNQPVQTLNQTGVNNPTATNIQNPNQVSVPTPVVAHPYNPQAKQESIIDTAARELPATADLLNQLKIDPLNLKSNPSKAIGKAIDTVKEAWKAEGDRINAFLAGNNKQTPKTEQVAQRVQVVSGAANVALSPITGFFEAANQIPVVGTVSKLISLPFSVVGEAAAYDTREVIKQLPISQKAKDDLTPAFEEINAIAVQLIAGKAMDITGKKLELTKTYGEDGAKTIVDQAQKVATEAKQGQVTLTPEQVRFQVQNTDLNGTPLGNHLLEQASAAEKAGQDVSISKSPKSDLVTPKGTAVETKLVEHQEWKLLDESGGQGTQDVVQPNQTTDIPVDATPKTPGELKLSPELSKVAEEKKVDVPEKFMSESEKGSYEQLLTDPKTMIDKYIEHFKPKDGGTIHINGDNAKEMFKGYNKTNVVEFDKAGGNLAKLAYQEALAQTAGDSRPVLFSAGGPGSGKSSALQAKLGQYSVYFDSNLANPARAIQRIDEAIKAGKEVDIKYVYRDAKEAFTNGVLKRYEEGDPRTVPVSTHVNQHAAVPESILKIAEQYKDNPKVDIQIIDNNHGVGNAKEVGLDFVGKIEYNKDELINELSQHTKQQLESGKLTQEQHDAIISGKITDASTTGKAQDVSKTVQPGDQGQKPSSPRDDIVTRETQLKEIYSNVPQQTLEEQLFNIWQELDVSEAGARIPITDESGSVTGMLGKKSTFPQWIPAELRQKDLVEKAKNLIQDGVESFKYPANSERARAVLDEVFNQLDQRTGVDTRALRTDIMDGYAIQKETKATATNGEAAKPVQSATAGSTEKGKNVSASKPQAKRSSKNELTDAFIPKNLEDPSSPKAQREVNKVIKRSEIARQLSEQLNVPIRRGKFRNPGALGIFKHLPEVVRIKSGGLQTVFHEVGHFLDKQFDFSSAIPSEEAKKLVTQYGKDLSSNPEKMAKEAFGEFLRYKMTGDSKIYDYAPEFNKLFNERLKQLPDIKKVIDTATDDFKRWNEMPASAKILSHISIGEERKPGITDRINAGIHELYTASLDDLHPLSEYSKVAKNTLGKIPAEKDPYILARNLRGWVGKAELFLTKGTFDKNFYSVENGKPKMNFKGKSYADIMKPIESAGKLDDFRVYLVAKRALELEDRNIVTGISPKDAREAITELEAKNPKFAEAAAERLAYKDQLLKYAADPSVGLIGQEQLAKIKELNKFHVPFYRVMETIEQQGGKFMGKSKVAGNLSSPIKRIKGSEREIIDPLESDIKDTYAILNASERNSIGVAMANLSTQNAELGRLFERVDRPMTGTKVNVKEVLDSAMRDAGVHMDIPEELADITATIFRPTMDRGANMLNVNMGDQKLVFQVEPELFKAIQGLNSEDVGLIMKVLSMPSKLLRAGATLTPDFSLRNPIRDQFSAFVYSKYGFVPGFDLMRGMFETFKKGDVYDVWKAAGGEHSMLVSMDRDYLQKSFKDILKGNGAKSLEYVTHPIKLLQTLSELGEQATRLGEMKRALEHGASPTEAAFASREVTLDFARVGTKTKAVNALIAFWNANVQGSDKMVRAFKERPFQSLVKVGVGITLPSVLLYMANRNDPRWKEIPGWQKDLFWIVFTKDHIWRIPKPFEVGIIFGSVPERIMEYMDNKNPDVFNQLEADIANGATPGFIPTTLLPVIENISNYSFFRDRPIVSDSKQGLPPEAQTNSYTSEVAKIIGKALNYSPAKVDNLIQGYTGGLGGYATSIIDHILIGTGAAKVTPKPATGIEDTPIIKAFSVRPPTGSQSESVNKLYSLYDEMGGQVTYVRKLVKEGRESDAKAFIKTHPEIVNVSGINAAVQAFSDINSARDIIINSPTLTPEQKKERIDRLNVLQTSVAEKILKELNYQK
jgi:hypothetical protein